MKLAKPTLIAAIGYAVLLLILLTPMNVGDYDPKMQDSQKFDIMYRIILVIVLLIPIALSLYSIDCMIKGRCVLWSYVNAVAVCVWVVLFFAASVVASRKSQNI